MNKIVRHAQDDKTLQCRRRTPQARGHHDSHLSLHGATIGGLPDDVP
jgi:hypothetical protein